MGGTIGVESALGQGTRFWVDLPMREAAESEAPLSISGSSRFAGIAPGQPRYRVLIVDDQVENWLLLRKLLEPAGFDVQVAENAETALEKFRALKPHFIWIDWRLPGMSGLEAARRIRELEGGRDVKIAALTALSLAGQREMAMAAGLDDFISKPFLPDTIFDCMGRLLGVRYIYVNDPPHPAREAIGALSPSC